MRSPVYEEEKKEEVKTRNRRQIKEEEKKSQTSMSVPLRNGDTPQFDNLASSQHGLRQRIKLD